MSIIYRGTCHCNVEAFKRWHLDEFGGGFYAAKVRRPDGPTNEESVLAKGAPRQLSRFDQAGRRE